MTTTAAPLRARSTISWGLLDQFVSSGTTFLFIIFAATSTTARELGAISFAFEFYLLSVMAARGVAGDPLTSRFSGLTDAELVSPTRAAAGASVLTGVVFGIAMAAGAWLAEDPLRAILLAAALTIPGLTLQDYVRAALIVRGRVRATFFNDALWVVALVLVMGAAMLADAGPIVLFLGWALTGCLAGVVGLIQLRLSPAGPRSVLEWLKRTRDLWPYYLADNSLFQIAASGLMFVVTATVGLAAMAGFRVAMTIYAPLSLVGRGVITVAVAMLARARDNPIEVRNRAMLISLVLTPMALCWGLLTLLIPTHLGTTFFGESWSEAEPVVFLASFVCASGLFGIGAVVGLRALSAGRETLVGRIVISILAMGAATAGGLLGETHGLFLALALVFPVQMLVWWVLLRRAAARPAQAGAIAST